MLSFSIITIFLDFILLLLPVPIIQSLQLSKKQRLAVCGLFFIGFIVCIAGIVHAYYVDRALVHSYDETWEGWPLWVASAIEVDLGIVGIIPLPCLHMLAHTFQLCVSVPAIRPLLAIYIPKLLESSRPPVRDLGEYDPNKKSELSGLSSGPATPGKRHDLSEKSASSYFSPVHESKNEDLERGGSRHTEEQEINFGPHS